MVASNLAEQLFQETVDAPYAEDDWETLVSKGIHLKDAEDATQWAKGDLCLLVDRRYGEGSIQKFASETKLGAAKTLYEQASIADFYTLGARGLNPELKWEHYRKAYRAVKKAEHKLEAPGVTALNWLDRAEKEGWTAAKMAREMALALGEQAKQRWQVKPCEMHIQGGYLIMLLPPGELERLERDVLPLKDKPTFDSTLSFSFTHMPMQGI